MTTTKRGARPGLSFKAFLSHRYKSPDVNLYFFRLFAETAEVQFEVDEGKSFTSVTRLERMIRGADAFIGIYPFPGTWEDARTAEKLRDASKYFRLELDLAARSRKPAVVFYDERYGDWVKPPVGIMSRTFNAQEVVGRGQYPHADLHRKTFGEFCEVVKARMAYDVARMGVPRDGTAIVVPTKSGAYTRAHVRAIEETLEACGCNNVRVMKWPPVLDRELFSSLQGLEMACVDIGAETAATGIPAFLHGRFIPSIRLKQADGRAELSSLERTLYGAVEVGYSRDILSWKNLSTLRDGLRLRIKRVKDGVRLVSTAEDAEAYFRSAALRNEPVFLSYSGKDADIASRFSVALKGRFQEVFDYRDGASISAGEPWLDKIYERLGKSSVGVPLLSENYFKSRHCEKEARRMVTQHIENNLILLPIKITEESVTLPGWLEDIQYLRLAEHQNRPELAAEALVRLVEREAEAKQAREGRAKGWQPPS